MFNLTHLWPHELMTLVSMVLAYLLGCICFAYYYVRFKTGCDIREAGTGNPGARNAGIVTGSAGFIITLAGDVFKGALATALPIFMGLDSWVAGLCMFLVVAGHIYPVQMAFRGGKGVATLIGALLVIDFRLAIGLAAITLTMLPFSHGFTKSGLAGIGSLPFLAVIMKLPLGCVVSITAATCLILMIHKKRETPAACVQDQKDHEKTNSIPRCYYFKQASEPWEFEQIHRLNYKTFVEEIPQHEPCKGKFLVDKFHDQNLYIICLVEKKVIGMLALRNKRPLSLDGKLKDLDSFLPPYTSLCEVRLLAVTKEHRNGRVLQGLLREATKHCIDQGYDLLVISGTTRQARLYNHLGFKPFGPLVGSPAAQYQPMYGIAAEVLHNTDRDRAKLSESAMYMLPGPVRPSIEVRQALKTLPVSHRSNGFVTEMCETKRMLCDLVSAERVYVLSGSGTLANDVIASQLALRDSCGLILSNGEFGERLLDHAHRANLRYQTIEKPWGRAFDYDEVDSLLAKNPGVTWVWFTHCETSTGMLNDLTRLKEISQKRRRFLYVDAISSIGTIPVDLRHICMASGVSNKGLGAFPGLAFVFESGEPSKRSRNVPRYLDLSCYEGAAAIPYTLGSNLVYALNTALSQLDISARVKDAGKLSSALRARLRACGFEILCEDNLSSPAITTVSLPPHINSIQIGNKLEKEGVLISYNSGYLARRNWIQFCFMGSSLSLTDMNRALDKVFLILPRG